MAIHAQTNYTLTTKPAKTSLLGGHFIYRVDTTQGTLTPSSANIVQNVSINGQDVTDRPSQWGYNTHIGANGIKLRKNEDTLSEWTDTTLTFYKPGTINPSLQINGGNNATLNIYNPESNVKTLGLDANGLSFYGTSTFAPDVTLNADGLTLINGSIRGGVVGQDEFLYLSPQVFSDEYEEYVLSTDMVVDETKTYYIRSGEEGEYVYTEVSEPTGNPQENEYYEIAHAPGTIPIDDYVKTNWRQIIGTKFAVDSDGNLYANNAHLNNADVEGAITATSLTIGGDESFYDGIAAINISGYSIEIISDSIGVIDEVNNTYLYPHLYHNGIEITSGIDYSHFVWYQDDETTGTEGDENNQGRYLATYGHSYRVIYDFDDGEVGGGTAIQTREVDPSKYITKISDTGITIHPEIWTNQSSYIQLDGTGMKLFDSNGDSIAKYGSTARIGKLNNSRFLVNSDSLQAYSGIDSSPYFEVNANGLSWGSNIAATTTEVSAAAQTASNYISGDAINGIKISYSNPSNVITNYVQVTSNGINIVKDDTHKTLVNSDGIYIYSGEVNEPVAFFGKEVIIGSNFSNGLRLFSNGMSLKDNNQADTFSIMQSEDSISGNMALSEGIVEEIIEERTATSLTITMNFNQMPINGTLFNPLPAGPRKNYEFLIYAMTDSQISIEKQRGDWYNFPVTNVGSIVSQGYRGFYININPYFLELKGGISFSQSIIAAFQQVDNPDEKMKLKIDITYDGERTVTLSASNYGDYNLKCYPYRLSIPSFYQTVETIGSYISLGTRYGMAGPNSLTLGESLQAINLGSLAIGQYNEIDTVDQIFSIGNGESIDERSNAFTVDWDGNVVASGNIDAKVNEYDYTKFTYSSGFTYYSTSGEHSPRACKFGRIVNLSGVINVTTARTGTAGVQIGTIPAECKPLYTQHFHNSCSNGQNHFRLTIKTDGSIWADMYTVAMAANNWFNISAIYISNS